MKAPILASDALQVLRAAGVSSPPSVFGTSLGGMIGLVQEGDSITVDAQQQLLQLNVDAAELERRKQAWVKPEPRYRTGVLGKYARLVSSSSKGAVTDQP